MTTTASKIKVRRVDFNNENISRHYMQGNVSNTHFVNSMHIVFPEGEKFFIRSARHYIDQIKDDPELLSRVKEFIGQEGVHYKQHEKFWDILEGMDLKPKRFAKFYNNTAYFFLERMVFNIAGKERGHLLALSVTAALEHFTALLGEGLLTRFPVDDASFDLKMLLSWHAAEELEHKSVCYDLYEKVGGDYPTRVIGMIISTFFLWFYIGAGQLYFIAVDKEKKWLDMPADFLKWVLLFTQSEGPKKIRSMYMDYYKKDFHPDDHDNYHLAEQFFEEHKAYFEKMGVTV